LIASGMIPCREGFSFANRVLRRSIRVI
jgi:hypothetical protein